MDFLFTLFAPLLGWITRVCYALVHNVGLSIIIFTLIVRVAMFPLSVKQQKTTSKTQIFTPKIREIQTKYRGNAQKMQEEMAKLQKQGYNPTAGCLPGILTMLILLGVLGVVYRPLFYFEHIPDDQIKIVREIAVGIEKENIDKKAEDNAADDTQPESSDDASADDTSAEDTSAENANAEDTSADNEQKRIKQEEDKIDQNFSRIQSELAIIGTYKKYETTFKERLTAYKDSPPSEDKKIEEDTIEKLKSLAARVELFGIDFSQNPTRKFPSILIPIAAFIFAGGQMLITQRIQRKTSPAAAEQMGAMKYMLYFMPFLSLFISFSFPAGAGFYWALSSAVGILQSILIYKLWPPEKLKAEVMDSLEKKGFSTDNVVVIEKPDGKKTTKKESEMSAAERKEYFRKKLEEARKADLEKYGEVGAPPKEQEPQAEQEPQESQQEDSEDGSDSAKDKKDKKSK